MRFRFAFPLLLAALCASCAYHTSVWVAPWQEASGTAVIANQSRIAEANPVWYTLAADGSIVTSWNAENAAIRAAFAKRRIVPTIQDFVGDAVDAGVVQRILADPAARARHAQQIVDLVMRQKYDGIDIDYEALPASARDSYSEFLNLLGTKLHQQKKRLSVTVSAKTSDTDGWDGPGAEDWRAIGRIANSVKIMAYDFHYSGSGPGPVAPLEWLGQIADYASKTMSSRKQVFGLPWYGYDWQGATSHSITYPQAVQLAASKQAVVARDVNGELFFRFEDHQVWFQDAESYREKVRYLLGRHPWIGGFAHWKSGSEDPEVWAEVENLNRRKVRGRS